MKVLLAGRGMYTRSIGNIVLIRVFGEAFIGNICGIIVILIILRFLRDMVLKVDIEVTRLLLNDSYKSQARQQQVQQAFQRKKFQKHQLLRLNRKHHKRL